jgi:glycosyltransferase involved in cell wall biosynthesis
MGGGLVSIIMPAYNVAGYIAESIKYIQNQVYTNWELLVINDGSTDNTEEVVNRLAQDDARICLHTQKNAGVSGARNKGLSLAQGQYITFLDADDLWEKEFLSAIIAAKEEVKADMGYCGCDRFYKNGYRRKYRYSYPSGWILPEAIQGTVKLFICALVINKTVLDANNIVFTEGCAVGEDWEFIAKILSHAQVEGIPRNLMLYRVRPGSAMTSRWKWEKRIDAINAEKRVRDYVLQHCQDRTEKMDQLVSILDASLSYKVYRFLWRMIKNGYHQEAKELMQKDDFGYYFEKAEHSDLGIIDKVKYRMVQTKNPTLWHLAKYL